MRTISFTEFRKHASDMITAVENGETIIVVRHGRPVAHVSPPADKMAYWKRPALRLRRKNAGLTSAILEEREHEDIL